MQALRCTDEPAIWKTDPNITPGSKPTFPIPQRAYKEVSVDKNTVTGTQTLK